MVIQTAEGVSQGDGNEENGSELHTSAVPQSGEWQLTYFRRLFSKMCIDPILRSIILAPVTLCNGNPILHKWYIEISLAYIDFFSVHSNLASPNALVQSILCKEYGGYWLLWTFYIEAICEDTFAWAMHLRALDVHKDNGSGMTNRRRYNDVSIFPRNLTTYQPLNSESAPNRYRHFCL